MKVKVYSIIIFLCAMSNITIAQDQNTRKDTVVTISDDRYKVVTNKFFDNWYIGIGAGVNMYFGDHDKQMKLGDRLAKVYSAQLGKWFSPGFGARLNFTLGDVKGVTQNGPYKLLDAPYEGKSGPGYWLSHEEFKYRHYHADALFNLTNLFGGYRDGRLYNLNFYSGLGWLINTTSEEKSVAGDKKVRDVSVNVGLENTFRLSDALDLSLDIRGVMVDDRFDGDEGERRQEGPLSALLAIKYKFNKRGWDKEKVVEIMTYDEAELNNLRERVNKLANDNDALRKQLADAGDKTITDIKIEKSILVAPILVTFPINKSVVSNEARVNLGFFAKAIKDGKSNVVYNISGYADKGTGNPTINERLSKERAEAIYNVLVREFGVPASQLTISHHGGVDNMYYDDPRLSRAVIVLGN